VIFGGLRPLGVGATPDSVRIEAQVVSTATGSVIRATEVSINGRLEEMTQLSDSITVGLLRGLGQSAYLGSLRGSDLGTNSLIALKAFLQGEYFYRRTEWDSAFTHYSRAVSLDTTIGQAYHRLGRVYGWQTSSLDSLTHYFRIEAARYNHGLPLRDSLLIAADSIRAVIGAVQTDPEYLDRTRRLFATLHRAVERYTSDPEVWYMLGVAQHHYGYGPQVGVPTELALESFDRAIALDSTFAPAYIHAVELGLMLDTTGRGMDYARKYISLRPTVAEGAGIGLVELLAAGPRSGQARATLDTASTSLLRDAFFVIRRWPDENELAVQVARVWLARALDGPPSDANFARAVLTAELAYRGHLRSAFESWEGASNRAFSDLANAGGIPDDTARKVIGGWIAADDPVAALALPWMARTGSMDLIEAFTKSARRRSRLVNPATGSVPGYDERVASAYALLARGDSAAALATFSQIPDVNCLGCVADRLVKARLLLAAGRPREAEEKLEERLPTLLSPAEVFFKLYLSEAAKQLGDTERAAEICGRVSRIWQSPDPELAREQARICN
jgi:serine/threonine-protein kinase